MQRQIRKWGVHADYLYTVVYPTRFTCQRGRICPLQESRGSLQREQHAASCRTHKARCAPIIKVVRRVVFPFAGGSRANRAAATFAGCTRRHRRQKPKDYRDRANRLQSSTRAPIAPTSKKGDGSGTALTKLSPLPSPMPPSLMLRTCRPTRNWPERTALSTV